MDRRPKWKMIKLLEQRKKIYMTFVLAMLFILKNDNKGTVHERKR